MARFSETIVLRRLEHSQNAEGVMTETTEDTEAFFNRYTVGLDARLAGRSSGLKGLATGQVRSCDYAGQQYAVLNGKEYTVEDASDSGEFTVLTLAERLPNGK